jgi:hypothetical protein
VLENEALAAFILPFCPTFAPPNYKRNAIKKTRNKAFFIVQWHRSKFLSFHFDFTPLSCPSLLPKSYFWHGQPCVNES